MKRYNFNRGGINPALIGKTPTVAQKIGNVSNKFGIPGINQQQGSALNIFDTVLVTTNANRQTLTFFQDSNTKSRTFSNWQSLEFKAGETLAVEYLIVELLQLSAADLTTQTTTITDSVPVGKTLVSTQLAYGLMSLKIANSTTVKDFQMKGLLPYFNKANTGLAVRDTATATQQIVGRSILELPVAQVIPPNQGIALTIEIPPITTGAGNWAVQVTLGEQGSIFSAKNTF